VTQNIELEIFIEDTNQLYKVYFNKSLHPTLPDYYVYLSESLNLPHPSTFKLKRDINSKFAGPVYITDVSEFYNDLKLILVREK
jgi:hypothetical protein